MNFSEFHIKPNHFVHAENTRMTTFMWFCLADDVGFGIYHRGGQAERQISQPTLRPSAFHCK